MTTEPMPSAETTEQPEQPAGPGPLAKFTRGADAPTGDQPAGKRQSLGDSQAEPGSQTAQPAQRPQPGKRRRPPKPPRDKQQAENAEVDRGLEAERGGRGSGPRTHVPIPSRRQRSEELEAEVAAALGGVSLDDIVAQEIKATGERLENESRHRAQVAEIHGDDVFFTLGGKSQGVASVRSFALPSGESQPPQVGDMVDVVVTGFNPEDNLYDLAIPGAAIVAGKFTDVAEGSLVEARI